MSYNKDRLLTLIREKSLTLGEVRLASGKISTYYIELSKVMFLPEGLEQIALGLESINPGLTGVDCVGGPVTGALPLVIAFMLRTGMRSFFVRPETKGHGLAERIEGTFQSGDRVLMVEDVTTTGHSLMRAVKAVEAAGGQVVRICSVLDREEGAKELFKDYSFASLLTVSEVVSPKAT